MTEQNKKNHNKEKSQEQLAEKPAEEKVVTLTQEEHKALLEEAALASDYKDRLLRLQAEFDNAKKRLEKDRLEFIKFANEGLIIELLGVLDDLERSVESANQKHEDYEAFLKGVEMILAHIYDLLKRFRVEPIEAKEKKFDPHFHEALLQTETPNYSEGTVLEELQKGYMMNGKVIRTAKVKVSKHAPEDREQKTEERKI
ncbi:MAG: nucleotide exchange factor GrpE [Candidatus Omnitrophota bacterium]|nr:nucleotide exchange factor GrpE [Candidatus Omnitrophota bacterium]